MTPYYRLGRLAALLLAVVLPSAVLSQANIDPVLEKIQQWVETERRIAREQAAWETDREAIHHLLAVYRQELQTLDEQITAAERDTSAAEHRRAELLRSDEALKEIEAAVTSQFIAAEKAVKTLYRRLPLPLQQETAPAYTALPDDPERSRLPIANRIQPLAALLTQIQKFNTTVTIVEEFREFERGNPVQVESIYFGLGAAYYVDQANKNAGVGVPGDDGWTWREQNEIADKLRAFLDIYRGKKQAVYIELPVTVR
jgi:hypothetical protein